MESPNTATVSGPCLATVSGVVARGRGGGLAGTGRGTARSPLADGGATATCGPCAGAVQTAVTSTAGTPPAGAGGARPGRPPARRGGRGAHANERPAEG